MQSEQPQNLRSLFESAKADKTALETNPNSSSDVNAIIAKFEDCEKLVGSLSLFSSNEPIEEISTGELQWVFLLLLQLEIYLC